MNGSFRTMEKAAACLDRPFRHGAFGAGAAGKHLRRKLMNAIVTVVGQDRVGIIAAVCTCLAENNVNILDISQTILQGSFTMVMAVDVGGATAAFGELDAALTALGREMGLSIRIQREEIFNAMHTI